MILPRLRRIVLIAVATIAMLVLGTYYYFEIDRMKQYDAAIEAQEKILRQKQDIVRNYKEKIEFYSTDEGMKHLAREQYNLLTSGDRVIILQ